MTGSREIVARRHRQGLLASLVLLAFVLRGADLISDPPADLEESGGYYADEGFWTHNARNKVLFGTWVRDDWNNMYASPLTHWPQYLSFRLMGVGLAQARVVPVLLSAACCALVALGLPGSAGIIAAGLLAVDPLLVQFGRIALLETPVIFLLLLSWVLLCRGQPGRVRLLLSGVAAGLAAATKLTVLFVVPAAVLSLLIVPSMHGRLKGIMWFLLGVTAAAGVWAILVGRGIPLFLQYSRFYASQQSPWLAQLSSNIARPVLFQRFRHSLPAVITGFVVAGGLLMPAIQARLPRSIVFTCLWFVLGAVYLDSLTYDPLRYYMPLLPALLILVAWAGAETWHGRLDLRPFPVGVMLLLLFLWPVVWDALGRVAPRVRYWPAWRQVVIFGAAVTCLSAVWWAASRLVQHRASGRSLALLVALACLVVAFGRHASWLRGRQHQVWSTGRELGERLHSAVLTGQWAPELCLENLHQAVPVWPGFVNGDDPFGRYGITHGVIWGRHWELYCQWFPQQFGRASVLDTFWIKDSPVILCAFPGAGMTGYEHGQQGSRQIENVRKEE